MNFNHAGRLSTGVYTFLLAPHPFGTPECDNANDQRNQKWYDKPPWHHDCQKEQVGSDGKNKDTYDK